MIFEYLIVLAVIQGITEFLPISSSSHLIIVPSIFGYQDRGLAIDVAVHFGSLCAVCLALWREIYQAIIGAGHIMVNKDSDERRLCLYLIIATLPIIPAGFFLKPYVETILRNIEIIAYATIAFGILLYISDKFSMTLRNLNQISGFNAFIIGMSQILALIPGVSRSGITITAARFMGMQRRDAARFSMLLSIPTIIAAVTLTIADMSASDWLQISFKWYFAAGLSFIFALIAIKFLLYWLNARSYTPFVLYRIALGCLLLYLI